MKRYAGIWRFDLPCGSSAILEINDLAGLKSIDLEDLREWFAFLTTTLQRRIASIEEENAPKITREEDS